MAERLTGPEREARERTVASGHSPISLGRLSLGLVLAPLAWVAAGLIGYYFAARSCELGWAGVPLRGNRQPVVMHIIIQVCAIAVAGAGVWIAVGNWRATRGLENPDDPPAWGRAHFMSFTGLFTSAILLLGIVLFAIPGFIVDACRQAR